MTEAKRPWNERPWGLYTQETFLTVNLKHIYLLALKVNINLCHDLCFVPEKIQTECECSEVHQRGGYTRDGPGQNQQQTGSWCTSFLWISIWIYELDTVTIVKRDHVCDLHVNRDYTERKERMRCTSTHWLEIFQSMCRLRSMPWTSVRWESITHTAVSVSVAVKKSWTIEAAMCPNFRNNLKTGL